MRYLQFSVLQGSESAPATKQTTEDVTRACPNRTGFFTSGRDINEMDANLAALLTVVVTSIASVVIALINARKSGQIEKKVDAGNAVGAATHTVANGRTEQLLRELAEKNSEIQRLSLLVPPPADKQ